MRKEFSFHKIKIRIILMVLNNIVALLTKYKSLQRIFIP